MNLSTVYHMNGCTWEAGRGCKLGGWLKGEDNNSGSKVDD